MEISGFLQGLLVSAHAYVAIRSLFCDRLLSRMQTLSFSAIGGKLGRRLPTPDVFCMGFVEPVTMTCTARRRVDTEAGWMQCDSVVRCMWHMRAPPGVPTLQASPNSSSCVMLCTRSWHLDVEIRSTHAQIIAHGSTFAEAAACRAY